MARGKFITIEGCDGSGKTTQKAEVAKYLRSLGLDVVETREPGGTAAAEKIREIILDPSNSKLTDKTEALLYAASRVQHIEEFIKPQLDAGKYVVCDRYIDSSIAYQGYARGLGADFIIKLFELTTGCFYPDITVFLDISASDAFFRKGGMDLSDRIERAGAEFHDRVYQGFVEASKIFWDRFITVDARADAGQITKRIIDGLRKKGIRE